MPCVVEPSVANSGGLEEGLPCLPVLGTAVRLAVGLAEHEVVVLPVFRAEPLGVLRLPVSFEHEEEFGRTLEGQFALALPAPEHPLSAPASRAEMRMSGAILRTGTSDADVSACRAVRFAGGLVLVGSADLRAGDLVVLRAARVWVVAAVPPLGALNWNHALMVPVVRSTNDQR